LRNNGVFTFTYDAANRLITVTNGTTLTLGYRYNGDGVLVAQTAGSVVTTFVQDVGGVLTQILVETSSGSTERHLYGAAGVLAWTEGGAWVYPLPDALGSVRQLTDESGQVEDVAAYSPFGLPDESGADAVHGFTGERWCGGVGLLFLRARMYAPTTGTFLSRDQVEENHPYLYADGNPVNATDPLGEQPIFGGPPPGNFPPIPPYEEMKHKDRNIRPLTYDPCKDWPAGLKPLCEQAEKGNLWAIEAIYEAVAIGEAARGYVHSSIALQHFLRGTSSPGSPLWFPADWVLSNSYKDYRARNRLKRKIYEYAWSLGVVECGMAIEPGTEEFEADEGVKKIPYGLPDGDVNLVLGNHTMRVLASFAPGPDHTVSVLATYYIYELFDFWKGSDEGVAIKESVGSMHFTAAPSWLDLLVERNRAAEYVTAVGWVEGYLLPDEFYYNLHRHDEEY
jgi:RHS repeat-associated protein